MDSLHVGVHVHLGDGPLAVRTHELLGFDELLAPALVVDSQPAVTNLAELVVFAALCMSHVTPFAACGALHALGTVCLQERLRSKALSAVRAGVL